MRVLNRRLLIIAAALSAASLLVPYGAGAQTDPRIAKAKQKGKVTWYTGVAPDELRSGLVNEFRAKTGLEVSIYYAGSGQIISRLTTERKTGSRNTDVVTLADLDLVAALNKDAVLRAYKSPVASSINPAYRDPNGTWYGFMFWGLSLAYNTKAVSPAEVPKAFADLADPKWKSKIVISDPARSATGLLLLKAMVAERGWDWVERLMRNDPLVIAVAPAITQSLVTGERILGAGVTPYMSNALKAGAPVAMMNKSEMLLIGPMTVSIVSEAPNQEGAELLVDYLLSQGAGKLFTQYGWFASRPDVEGPYGFPPSKDIKVIHPKVTSPMTREEILAKYNAILQSTRK